MLRLNILDVCHRGVHARNQCDASKSQSSGFRLFANSGEDFSMVPPHSYLELFGFFFSKPQRFQKFILDLRHLCEELGQEIWIWKKIQISLSNLSHAAFEEGFRVVGLA